MYNLPQFNTLLPHFNPADVADRKLTSDEEEARRIAEMGKPVLGEHSKLEVIIEESYEFKVGEKKKHRRWLNKQLHLSKFSLFLGEL